MVRLFGREDRRRHELLSAYVDGEVTAEEAREVEELLETSEDAGRELSELQATVDLVRGLPDLDLPRSFALDAAPKKRWTLWWPSVRTTGLATSVATMLLVALVAGDMLNVLEQARFGVDDSEYASDDSAFTLAAAPAAAQESAAVATMDAPASPEPEAAVMKSVAAQEESAQAPAAPAAAAPGMGKVEASEEPAPAAAMQQDTTEEAPEAATAESSEEPVVALRQAAESSEEPVSAMQQAAAEEAPQADAVQSSEAPPVAIRQVAAEEAQQADEIQADEVLDDPESDTITLPLVELQIVAAIVAVVLGGATLVAVRRRRRSVL